MQAIVDEESLSASVLSSAKENLEWSEKYLSPIEAWFDEYDDGTSSGTTLGISSLVVLLVLSVCIFLM